MLALNCIRNKVRRCFRECFVPLTSQKAIAPIFFLLSHALIPSPNFLVQSQLWKHQNNVWNLLKVNNKDTRTASMTQHTRGHNVKSLIAHNICLISHITYMFICFTFFERTMESEICLEIKNNLSTFRCGASRNTFMRSRGFFKVKTYPSRQLHVQN